METYPLFSRHPIFLLHRYLFFCPSCNISQYINNKHTKTRQACLSVELFYVTYSLVTQHEVAKQLLSYLSQKYREFVAFLPLIQP